MDTKTVLSSWSLLVFCYWKFDLFSFSYQTGLMSGNFLSFEEDVLSKIQPVFETRTLYIYLTGAMFGASIAGGFCICGKKSIMVGDTIFITGTVISCSSSVAALLTIGKGLMGFGLGWLFTGGPLLILEGSPPQIRGTLGSCFGIMLNTGIFFAYGAATFLADVSLYKSEVSTLI